MRCYIINIRYRWGKSILMIVSLILSLSSICTYILYANPVPSPIAPLLSEDIHITIWVEGKSHITYVTRLYELGELIGSDNTLTLRFPIPNNSWDRSIYIDSGQMFFNRVTEAYTCKLMEVSFDILESTISRGEHNMEVRYTHRLIDLGNSTHLLIYPIGSSRLALNATHTKGCRYDVNIETIPPLGSDISFEVLKKVINPNSIHLNVYLDEAFSRLFKIQTGRHTEIREYA